MKKIFVTRKPRICPICRSKVARIFYGLPIMTMERMEAIDKGEIVLGGDIICTDDPDYQCVNCGQRFWKKSC